ncbi:MAG: serine/threonine-protein kinase [Deltaproteobacteria bacterium]|nr:serine/threonine-protein kinase [Deltaproteobacteria bacterium]
MSASGAERPPGSTTTKRWGRLKEAFQGSLERPPEERLAYLDEFCGADLQLRSEVLALLREDREIDPVLEAPIADRLIDLLPEEPVPVLVGESLGAYRVLKPVGRGGQSTVYLGERNDGQFQQRVAVKVLDRGNEPNVASLERQILATLSHPGIARLLDAGSTDEGFPYFVMEWVDGLPIDVYCQRHGLGLRQRLEVFLEVCAAVQHAHQSLVVHSDLKPGNILVTVSGRAKLLDFGIARLLEQALFSLEASHRTLCLTPAYASPEQHRGEPLSAASDVYSLGVILYQLLAGVLPSPQPGEDGSTLVAPSNAPGATAEVQRWLPRLRGDLDAIVLKTLASAPGERYPSVAALEADLRRFLGRRPVEARHGSWVYRWGRWLRRRPLTAAALALSMGALIFLTLQQVRLRTTRVQLEQERHKTKEMNRFLEQLVSASEPISSDDQELTVRQVLDQASRSVAVGLAHLPTSQASLLATLGRSYKALRLYERSEESLEAALQLRQAVFGPHHEAVAQSLGELAHLRLAQEDVVQAEALGRQALEMRRDLLGEVNLPVAESLNDLGEILLADGRPREAEVLLLEALEMRRKLVGPEHRAILESYFELAFLHREEGNFERAIELYRKALPLARKLLGDGHLETILLVNDYGFALREMGEPGASEELFREAIAGFEALLGEDHPWVLISQANLARQLRDEGRFSEAESLLQGVLEARRRIFAADDPSVAHALRDLGLLRLQEERFESAETYLRESLSILRSSLPAESWMISRGEGSLGECLTRLGRYEEAEPLLQQSLLALERRWGPDSRRSQRARERLWALYRASGKTPPAGLGEPPLPPARESLPREGGRGEGVGS